MPVTEGPFPQRRKGALAVVRVSGCRSRRVTGPGGGQGSCKVVKQAVDLLGCWRRGAAIWCRIWAVASPDRPPDRSDLGRRRVLTMQVEGTAVVQVARLRPLAALTAGQAGQTDFARALPTGLSESGDEGNRTPN